MYNFWPLSKSKVLYILLTMSGGYNRAVTLGVLESHLSVQFFFDWKSFSREVVGTGMTGYEVDRIVEAKKLWNEFKIVGVVDLRWATGYSSLWQLCLDVISLQMIAGSQIGHRDHLRLGKLAKNWAKMIFWSIQVRIIYLKTLCWQIFHKNRPTFKM